MTSSCGSTDFCNYFDYRESYIPPSESVSLYCTV